MNPTLVSALKWVGAVGGMLVVAYFALGGFVSAVQSSVEFGNDLVEADDAAPAGDEDAPEAGDEAAGDENGDEPADDAQAPEDQADDEGDEADDEAEEAEGGDDPDDPDDTDDTAQDRPETYEVQAGDHCYGIAEETMGDGERWPELEDLNDISCGALEAGMILDIPQD